MSRRSVLPAVVAIFVLVAGVGAVHAAPAVAAPPLHCVGTKPVALCDSAGLLNNRSVRRVLRAASRLAQRRCGAVVVVIGTRQPPTLISGCELRVHMSPTAASVTGRTLSPRERASAIHLIEKRIEADWLLEDAVVEALRELGHPYAPSWMGMALCSLLISMALLVCIRRHFPNLLIRPHYERCRRALKRLDDARARARASKFPADSCPICLEALRPRKRRRDASISGSSSSGSDDGKSRSLPCGHTFHSACLVQWVASPARNRAACPVCRAPVLSNALTPPPFFSWRGAATVLSDNFNSERRRLDAAADAEVLYEENSEAYSVQDVGGGASDDVVVQWDETGDDGLQLLTRTPQSSPHSSTAATSQHTSDTSLQDSSSHYR